MQKKLEIGKEKRGITLLALVITVIILVILAGVGISAINSGNIFENAANVVEQSKIASKKEEIELVIISKMNASVREITIDKIIEALEKKGIIDEGNSNEETGQVKTNPDGYIYEITEKPNGDWDVKYVGKGELDTRKIKLSVELSTTVITDKVTITVTAKASAGVKSITMPDGSIKTYTGKTEVSETYEVTKNGEYTFTATNNKGETESKTITIDNILEGTIQISANPSEATNKSVTVTIEWPSGSENAIKEICSNGENKYTTVSGVKTTLTLNNNCVVKARIRNSVAEIKTATLNVTNIDRLAPKTFIPTATTTSNSITITGSTTDQLATEKYGSSGISAYYFSKDNGTSWQTNEDKTQTSHTYTELTQGTEYTIKMKAIDKAGNETITDSITATTINIANLGDIQISATPSTPTNKDVTVTVTWPSDTTGLTKKISKDNGTNWSDYTGPITVSSNCIVKAKLIDTTSQEGKTATANITNIDKTNPTVTAKQSSVTITEGASNALSNYFTITANGTYGISSTIYTDTSNSNAQVTNTNTLKVGTHTIKCTATKETGATASATMSIVVKSSAPPVDSKGLATENTIIKPSTSSNIQIVIPKGFAPVILEGSGTTSSLPGQSGKVKSIIPAKDWKNITIDQINQGIVVVDNSITYTNNIPNFNEFVWVPIAQSSDFARVAWNGKYYISNSGTGTHPLASTATQNKFWEETNTALNNSVNTYKGFYIGRYEASNNGSGVAQSKRGQNYWERISPTNAKSAATKSSIKNMHLIYGIEWDSTLKWFIGNAKITSSYKTMTISDIQTDSSSWANTKGASGGAATGAGSCHTTGYSEYWKANNIYDMAGNIWEWTQERASSSNYVERGGYVYLAKTVPAAFRDGALSDKAYQGLGFRIAFYI